jgi:hypothetical protein
MELDLRTSLGTEWIALKGWPAQEVRDGLHPALELANSLCRNDALLPILFDMACSVLGFPIAQRARNRWKMNLIGEPKRDGSLLIRSPSVPRLGSSVLSGENTLYITDRRN